ncbi:hypothetical protein [Rhodopseudomonas palustris]|uniref:hypothetical protein n=1 Tax=Rhodopseudomonas palustris TaxID=1076 RepID=UPI0021F3B812|nr:hypothetical protein [Rhodopseudomonas palustris]UYO54597.1 hypothetical protein KQX61_04015 [Rhodopseudomonas palustris]
MPQVALAIVNPGDVTGLAPDNSASAELGLALAKLMYIAQSPAALVIATGALDTGGGEANVRIRPIHHLRTKLSHVLEYFGQPGVSSPPELFFTPETDVDGALVVQKYAELIACLRTIGIIVVPVGTLRDAAAKLGAMRIAAGARQRWGRRAIIAAGLLATMMLGLFVASERSIVLEFMPRAFADGRIVETPVRLRELVEGGEHVAPPCTPSHGLPLFQVGEQFAAEVRSGDVDGWMEAIDRHYHVLVAVSAKSGSKVLTLPAPTNATGIKAGDTIRYRFDIVDGPDEDNLIVVLARRWRPFDAERLSTELHHRLDHLQPTERLAAARAYLASVAPGALEFMFRTVKGDPSCL